ncbi:hypothetical protein [Streptomyces sp. YIM 121038]|uniref:hypothetical protein n=1 Tax=Streptomyces sp. YIM 121038 TaxID=2136401 RepID=UPI0011100E8A|nr:hypothetical protein [Streptomyces sp. YIM 121038]
MADTIAQYGDIAGAGTVRTEGPRVSYTLRPEIGKYVAERRKVAEYWHSHLENRALNSPDVVAAWVRGTSRIIGDVLEPAIGDEYDEYLQGVPRYLQPAIVSARSAYDNEDLDKWLRRNVPWKSLSPTIDRNDAGAGYSRCAFLLYNDKYHIRAMHAYFTYVLMIDDVSAPPTYRLDGWADRVTSAGIDVHYVEGLLREDLKPSRAYTDATYRFFGLNDAEKIAPDPDGDTSARWGFTDDDGSIDAYLLWRCWQTWAGIMPSAVQTLSETREGRLVSAQAYAALLEVTTLAQDYCSYPKEFCQGETSNILYTLDKAAESFWLVRRRCMLLIGVYAPPWHATLQDAESSLVGRANFAMFFTLATYAGEALIVGYCARTDGSVISADVARCEASLVDLLRATYYEGPAPESSAVEVLCRAVCSSLAWFAPDPGSMLTQEVVRSIACSLPIDHDEDTSVAICIGQQVLTSAQLWGHIGVAYRGPNCVNEWLERAKKLSREIDQWLRILTCGAPVDHARITDLAGMIRRDSDDLVRPSCGCDLPICRGAALYQSTVCAWVEFGPIAHLYELNEAVISSS